jgi:hypothetical protein
MAEQKSFAERFASSKKTFTSQNLVAKNTDRKNTDQILEGLRKDGPSEPKDGNDFQKVDPIKRSQASLIYLVKGIDDSRNAWYYVLVERPKLQLFLKALNDDIIHLENYGKVLYSAYGDEPPQDVTDALNAEYGIR